MGKDNVVKTKSYDFALNIVLLCKDLQKKNEFILSKQLLRSATSIGANVEEAIQGESKADFIHKFSISQKESFETMYWLRLLNDSGYLKKETADNLMHDCQELQRILTAIIKSSKQIK